MTGLSMELESLELCNCIVDPNVDTKQANFGEKEKTENDPILLPCNNIPEWKIM